MATKYADGYDSNLTNNACSDSGTGCVVTVPFEYQFTAKLATGDVLHLVPVPKGALVTDLYIYLPDMDSGSSTWDCNVGDSDGATSLLSTVTTVGRAAGAMSLGRGLKDLLGTTSADNTLPKRYSSADSIKMTVTAEGNTAATTGTVKGYVTYTLQHSASNKSSHVYGGVR